MESWEGKRLWWIFLMECLKMKGDYVHQLWDKLVKIIGDIYPKDLVEFVFPGKRLNIIGKYEQEKIVVESQISDINFLVEDDGIEKILNIEPYAQWDDSIPGEVFTKNGVITRSLDHKKQVITVVLLLEKESRQCVYKVTLGKQVVNQAKFPVVTFQNIEQILKRHPVLAPFVLKVNMKYKPQVMKIIKQDKLLIAMTVMVLNRLGFTQQEALLMTEARLQEFREALLEVPIMQDIWKEDNERAKLEEKQTIAKNMLAKGYAIAAIAEVTGLSADEIRQLKAKPGKPS